MRNEPRLNLQIDSSKAERVGSSSSPTSSTSSDAMFGVDVCLSTEANALAGNSWCVATAVEVQIASIRDCKDKVQRYMAVIA